MSIHITDEQTAASLAAAGGPDDVCGPDGRVIGRFIPFPPGMSCPEVGVTDAELARRLADPTTVRVPADQVLPRLRGRAACSP